MVETHAGQGDGDGEPVVYKWTSPPAKLLLPNKTKIAVAQMNCTEDKEENLEVAINFIKTAATKHASMIFFPECFDFVGENKAQTLQLAEPLDGFLITRYSELAKQFGIWISLGGFHEHEKDEGERVVPTTGGKADDEGGPCLRNAHLLLNPEGELVSVYRKMHLFNVDIPEKNISLHESSYVRPGDELVLSEVTPIGRIGLGVCYDLRFPEFGMAYRAQGAHVLTYPSAFTVHTGQAHWEPLCRARAIENQCFVIAAAQCGEHNAKRASYGNSVIVDPWGTILAQAEGSNPGLIFAEIDLAHLEKVRQEMPVISHKAPGLLSVLGKDSGLREDEYTAQNALVTNILTAAAPETKSELGLCTIPTTDNSRAATFLFGPIVAKYEIVFLENKNARAFVNRKCIVPGHVLISTKRVAKRLSDLYPEEVADLFLLAQKVEQIMESVHNVTSSTVTLQDGKDAGQTVPHVHIHVVPRKVNDFEDNDSIYKELATHDKGADIAWRKPEEMKDECDRLRAYIRTNFPQFLAP
ncbi:nitrilase and fragile histidine triad fusion protein NitFhit isoform X3 [Folsomia candida]|uniref:nitrilase and fragile histidine triad fusion protein NitFhit isoform X3 n=1 Tax=Folsomia candida TaxID=158441 RepID=UPI000B8F8A7D|nr:nitrilase and fragile histidine triad fusion protein NitFhit isoform X3 [Folsomia candida]